MSRYRYSEEELLEDLRRVSEECCNGDTPTMDDYDEHGKYSCSTYESRFGSWNESLKRCNFEVNERRYTKEELISEINKLSEEYCDGYSPSLADLKQYSQISQKPFITVFGSWGEALEYCGFNAENQVYSEKELLDKIKNVSEKHLDGETPSSTDIGKYTKHGKRTYSYRFGSWTNALKEAGFQPLTDEEIAERHRTPKEKLENEMQRISEEFFDGEAPKFYEWIECEETKYSVTTYKNTWGSWTEALEGMGFDKHSTNNDYYIKDISEKEVKEKIRSIYNERGCISKSIFKEETGMTPSVVKSRLGNWTEALEEMGIPLMEPTEYLPSGEDHANWKEESDYDNYYGSNWHTQKKKALERDDEKCRVCKKEVEHYWHNKPDVHHIKPKYKWNVEEEYEEMNDLDNLICLCKQCHHPVDGEWQDASPDEFVEKARNYLDIDIGKERSVFDY